MANNLPRYSTGDYESADEVNDNKSQPPGYAEASSGSALGDRISGQVYASKQGTSDHHASRDVTRCPNLTVHSTENDNFVLLDQESASPVYFVDNTSSLSKTIVRAGDSSRAEVISISKSAGPFVREIQTDYESKVRSGSKETLISAEGKFSVVWTFTWRSDAYEWKSHKGVWTLHAQQSHAQVAQYDAGRSLNISDAHLAMSDVVVSTVFAIFLHARLTTERRHRALNSVSGKSSTPLLGGGLLL